MTSGLLAAAALLVASVPVAAYTVQAGDTLWSIYRRTGVSVVQIVALNQLQNPNLIQPGQSLRLSAPPPPPPTPQAILVAAAQKEGVSPSLILALSDWESGWNESAVSPDGAIGLMQIMPATASWAGPHLLGRTVNLNDATDNATLGSVLIGYYLSQFNGDQQKALAAYYQGFTSVKQHGIKQSSRRYVNGILDLAGRITA